MASVVILLKEYIRGINAIMLISNPIQAANQEEEELVTRVPKNKKR